MIFRTSPRCGYVSLPKGNNSLMSQAFFPGGGSVGGLPLDSHVHEPREELLQRYLLQEKNARNYLDRVSGIKPNLELLLSLGVGLLKDIILSGLETSHKKNLQDIRIQVGSTIPPNPQDAGKSGIHEGLGTRDS